MFKTVWSSDYYKRALLNYMLKGYKLREKYSIITALTGIVNASINFDDISILKLMISILRVYVKKPVDHTRADERVKSILSILPTKVEYYLDYGCGDGSITSQLGQALRLDSQHTFGIDIHAESNPNITYLFGGDTGLKTQSIDLVTAFVSFHHIVDLDGAMKEITRVLKPGGSLIIREHNHDGSELLRSFLNLIHMFIAIRDHADCDLSAITSIKYRSSSEWTTYIESFGFKLHKTTTYEGNNPQKLYYASYTKL